jgi:hypothetical protein
VEVVGVKENIPIPDRDRDEYHQAFHEAIISALASWPSQNLLKNRADAIPACEGSP